MLLLDKADGLVGEAMVSFLTQLRHGYAERRRVPFPVSLALVGQRKLRDATFNITAEATTGW